MKLAKSFPNTFINLRHVIYRMSSENNNQDKTGKDGGENSGIPEIITCKNKNSTWAAINPVVVFETPAHQKRMAIYPEIHKNSSSKQVIRAHLVYEPLQADEWGITAPPDDLEKISKEHVSLNTGKKIDLEFSSEELSNLVNCLNAMELINKISLENLNYIQIINIFSMETLNKLIKDNWRLKKSEPNIYDCLMVLTNPADQESVRLKSLVMSILKIDEADVDLKILKEILGPIVGHISGTNSEEMKQLLSIISNDDRKILRNHLNVLGLESLIDEISREIMNDHPEKYWQKKFTSNNWIISQIFHQPMIFEKEKVHIGGQTLDKNGGVADYLYKNKLTSNISLIEIKKSTVKLVNDMPYRTGLNTYSMSDDVVGGVIQVLDYKNTLLNETYKLLKDGDLKSFDPQCVLIVGSLNGLNEDQIRSFELYRNNLKNVTIITYDEVIERLRVVLSLFNKRKPSELTQTGMPIVHQ